MNGDLEKAKALLSEGDYTCVVCREEYVHTSQDRGVKPLLNWLEEGMDLKGFSAADRVVGRATAFLYVLLGVKAVHARIISRPAAAVLETYGIESSAEKMVEGIINRRGDGPCPFEAAVLEITDAGEALAAIRNKQMEMRRGEPLMENGIQVSSLKPLLLDEAQVRAAFSRMRELGCKTVQLQWIDPSVPAAVIAGALRENDMKSVSVQDFYEVVRENYAYYTELNRATGGKWLCVSRIPERLKSEAGIRSYIEELRELRKLLAPLGQELCFHPVSGDYTAVPGICAVEYLLDHMPELDLCLDLYHLNRNCADMPGFIRKYGKRICMVHFKDSRGEELVPAGQGDTDWSGVVNACLEVGVPYAFVEQERWNRDPYDCLKEAMAWLDREMVG